MLGTHLIKASNVAEGGELTFIDSTSLLISNNVTSIALTVPTGTQNGDLMVAVCGGGGGANDVSSWASSNGFTIVVSRTTRPNLMIAYKVASSEGSTVTFTTGASCKLYGALLTYRGAQWGVTGSVSAASNKTVTASSVTVPSDNSILLLCVSSKPTVIDYTDQGSMVAVEKVVNNSFGALYTGSESVNSGASGTRTVDQGTSLDYEAALVSLSPI